MRLDWLRAFRAVMQTGTATGAAAILLRTQPQVSRMIASLEDAVGLKLFRREGRRLVPTEQALLFLQYVEPLLIGLEGIGHAADDIRHDRGRPLLVAAEPFLLHKAVPEAITALNAAADFRCTIDICIRGLGLWMSRGNADLGVVALPFSQTDMERTVFAEAEVVAVLPPGHRLAAEPALQMQDLRNERFIGLSTSTLLRAQIDIAAARVGISLDPVVNATSGVTACDFVARGLGMTIADPIIAQSFVSRGVTVRRLRAGLKLTYGYLTARQAPSAAARLAMDMIAATVSRLGGDFVTLAPAYRHLGRPASAA
ncbi:LysR substrate-binding domain-containing protein [Acuticoccus mangrovi]|uniref:LysR family transcriptional regulator n=1 Tax=Acuticoccus mangrovi TaxID=2796142 RepID=A0A934MJG7_9HYPH|nr:LysR substrate-binding domain-containing protein [Acuticoccus mangrovi]MBJ3778870.1 LysR family transcriptional regulator [Acuticoccus mangrovi]